MDIPLPNISRNREDFINFPRREPVLDGENRYIYFPSREVTLVLPPWSVDAMLPEGVYTAQFSIGRILIKVTDVLLPLETRNQQPVVRVNVVKLEDQEMEEYQISSLLAQWIQDIYFGNYPEYQTADGIYLYFGDLPEEDITIEFSGDSEPDRRLQAYGDYQTLALLKRIPVDSRKRSRLDMDYPVEHRVDPQTRAALDYIYPDERYEQYNVDEYREMVERR